MFSWHPVLALMGYGFQSDDRAGQCHDEDQSPYSGRLFEYQYTRQYGSHCAYSCPYSISRTDR